MTKGMSLKEYREAVANTPKGARRNSHALRVTGEAAEALLGKPVAKVPVQPAAAPPPASEGAGAKPDKKSSAQKTRERVGRSIDAVQTARVEVEYEAATRCARIRVIGGTTLPVNRMLNMASEKSMRSKRTFSAFKHACKDRMGEAAMLLRSAKGAPFSRDGIVEVEYDRIVIAPRYRLDPDSVIASFKYYLDGLVEAGILRDDRDEDVRIKEGRQSVAAQAEVIITLRGI